MNVFKYVFLKLKELFSDKDETVEYKYLNDTTKEVNTTAYLLSSEANKERLLKSVSQLKDTKQHNGKCSRIHYSPIGSTVHIPIEETVDVYPASLAENDKKPKREYNRATKQQVSRIKVLVGRGKNTKAIAKDVGLPYDNVNYYVKKFSEE